MPSTIRSQRLVCDRRAASRRPRAGQTSRSTRTTTNPRSANAPSLNGVATSCQACSVSSVQNGHRAKVALSGRGCWAVWTPRIKDPDPSSSGTNHSGRMAARQTGGQLSRPRILPPEIDRVEPEERPRLRVDRAQPQSPRTEPAAEPRRGDARSPAASPPPAAPRSRPGPRSRCTARG